VTTSNTVAVMSLVNTESETTIKEPSAETNFEISVSLDRAPGRELRATLSTIDVDNETLLTRTEDFRFVDETLSEITTPTFVFPLGSTEVQTEVMKLLPDPLNEEHEEREFYLLASSSEMARYLQDGTPKSFKIIITDDDAPAAPVLSLGDEAAGQLSASWTKPDGPVGSYEIRYRRSSAPKIPATTPDDPATGWVTFSKPGTTQDNLVGGLLGNVEYAVQVRANDGQTGEGNGWGPWSTEQTQTPLLYLPSPDPLTVTPDHLRLTVAWVTPINRMPIGYDVHYTSANTTSVEDDDDASGNDPTAAWVNANHSGTTVNNTITGLVNGTEYRVRVRAKFNDGVSDWITENATPVDERNVLRFKSGTYPFPEKGRLTGAGKGNYGPIEIKLDRVPDEVLDHWIRYADGTAVQDFDYSPIFYDGTFLSGVEEYEFDVGGRQDNINEEHETFAVSLEPTVENFVDLKVGAPARTTVTILDDDPPEAPTDLSVIRAGQSVTASWSKPTGPVTKYQLRWGAVGRAPNTPTTWPTRETSDASTSFTLTRPYFAINNQLDVQVRAI